ncbi:MAG: 50S ribosomal protein L37Ae [Candidatus Aenigmarchaeota archaeon]|nr:50S ribosomal protein L37Ae [Candidatus Aenigmarchaeota archaeon]MCK5321863.1 50S ribosomal protein L37Ae [Candidatus Aenigmarchaeota archaeon]
MAKTKKVLSGGRFGVRYGKKIRQRVGKIEQSSRAKFECPFCCTQKKLKRGAAGIWECSKCGIKLAGGAYSPSTTSSKIMKKS